MGVLIVCGTTPKPKGCVGVVFFTFFMEQPEEYIKIALSMSATPIPNPPQGVGVGFLSNCMKQVYLRKSANKHQKLE